MATGVLTKHVALNASTATSVVTNKAARKALYLRNASSTSAEVIRIGDSTVTKASTAATAGFGIPAGETLVLLSSPQQGTSGAEFAYSAISESGTPTLEVMEVLEF